MAQLAFIVNTPAVPTAAMGNFIDAGNELVRIIRKDLGDDHVYLDQVAKTDQFFVAQSVGVAPDVNSSPLTAKTFKIRTLTVAGAAAGNLAVTGIKAKSALLSVVFVDDTTHVGVDRTSEFTVSAADQINNTGKTASTGAHVVVTWS